MLEKEIHNSSHTSKDGFMCSRIPNITDSPSFSNVGITWHVSMPKPQSPVYLKVEIPIKLCEKQECHTGTKLPHDR